MAKYEITHSCGHTETVKLFGKTKDREWRIKKMESEICPDCYKQQLIEADKKAAEQNAAEGLPELEGSEKQVLWAEKIRADRIDIINKIANAEPVEPCISFFWNWRDFDEFISKEQRQAIKESCENNAERYAMRMQLPIMQIAVDLLRDQTSAHWWIDNREYKISFLLANLLKTSKPKQDSVEESLEQAAQAEATVRPEQPETETVAEIAVTGDSVKIAFPEKVEEFRLLMRKHGYRWQGDHWLRTLNKRNGVPQDRAAEIGHILLGSNFIIRIYDEAVRNAAIDGHYTEEQTRWITAYTSGKHKGRFCISWHWDDDFYRDAKRLPTARYVKPNISVGAEHFDEILDFAEVNGFSLSDAAMALVDSARKAKQSALVAKVDITPVQERRKGLVGAPEKMDVPEDVEVNDELRD